MGAAATKCWRKQGLLSKVHFF